MDGNVTHSSHFPLVKRAGPSARLTRLDVESDHALVFSLLILSLLSLVWFHIILSLK